MQMKISPEDQALFDEHKWLVSSLGYLVRYPSTGGIVLFHRVIFGAQKGQMIDHINGDSLDNRRENLRVCSHSENMQNRKTHKNNRLGVKGVYQKHGRGNFYAQITAFKRKVRLGAFPTLKEAKSAYDKAAKALHGEFARLA